MRLLECQHALAHQEGNNPDFRLYTLSKFLNIAGIFWSFFLLGTACISREDFLSNAGMCFGGVLAAINTVLRSLRGKILLRINKSWVQNFPRHETISYCSRVNNRIEINNFCCLVSCSKRLYKWKSLGAGSNSSTIVISIINAQWQLFDSD